MPSRALSLLLLALAACDDGGRGAADASVEPDATSAEDAGSARDAASDAGHAVLTQHTPIEPGSECPLGGRRVEVGLDDGSGGGVAGDGVLSPGEVDDSYADCDNELPDPSAELEPPGGPAGSAVIDLRGGSALAGLAGGAGGTLRAEAVGANPCLAEVTRFFASGALTQPDPDVELGDRPLRVSGQRTLAAAELADLSGLHVAAGARVSLPADATITLTGDAWIEGELLVSGALVLQARRIVASDAARIAGAGARVTLAAAAGVSLAGTVDVSGSGGGAGGAITISSVDTDLLSRAVLRADGGDAAELAGPGGTVTLRVLGEELGTQSIKLSQAGSVSARGGSASGASGRGGAGGQLVLSHCLPAQSIVELLGVEAIELGGGDASAASGSAGRAGALRLALTYGVGEARRVALHVPVRATGGSGRSGGDGGALQVDLVGLGLPPLALGEFPVLLHAWPSWVPAIVMASRVTLDAGDSGEGPAAVAGSALVHARGGLELRGRLEARGGASSSGSASPGGSVTVTASGNLAVSGQVDAAGGDGGALAGGRGGCISLSAPMLDLRGTLSASGGDGEPPGSAGAVHNDGSSCATP